MAEPIGSACESCGLYQYHPNAHILQVEEDKRPNIFEHRVLIVLPSPRGNYAGLNYRFTDDPSFEWLLDYLQECQFHWLLTCAVLCPPKTEGLGKESKFTPTQILHCATSYMPTLVHKYAPHAILTCGTEGLSVLWPASRGKVPSITKARIAPVRLDEIPGTPWLLSTYNPRQHSMWLDSNGVRGQDLTEEYIRCFELLHKTLREGYVTPRPNWKLIQTCDDLRQLLMRCISYQVDEFTVDIEDKSWLGRNLKVWQEDPDGVLPLQLTMHHPDNDIICLGITIPPKFTGVRETYCISPDELHGPNAEVFLTLLEQLLTPRKWRAWNVIYEMVGLCLYLGIPIHKQVVDDFIKRGLRDQSLSQNDLKMTAMELLGVPNWEEEQDKHLELARKLKRAQGLPDLVCMADVPREVNFDYNAHDTWANDRLEDEVYAADKLGDDFPWRAYNELIDGLPWLAQMELNGIPVDEGIFNQVLDELESEESRLLVEIRQHPNVQRAEAAWTTATQSKVPLTFNTRSPVFYKHLILEFYGQPDSLGNYYIPDNIPRTESGQISRSQETIAKFAGEDIKEYIPVEKKSDTQLFWHKVMRWKEAGDDFSKMMGIFDYVVEGRLHSRYRILKSDIGTAGGDADATAGGTVSGRFSSSPNVQNIKKTERFMRPFVAPPGWKWIRLDYGRIELAWLAWNSGDDLMCQWAREGKDAHKERGMALWCTAFGKTPADFLQIDEHQQAVWRAKGKTQNFASVYMEEPETTAKKTGASVEQVISDILIGRKNHPKILQLQMELYDTLNNGGVAITTLLGRRRSAPGWRPSKMTAEQFFSMERDLRKRRDMDNLALFRSIWNSKGAQSDASDTTFCKGKQIQKLLWSGEWLHPEKVYSVGFIHDSLDYLVREDYVEVAEPEIKRVMKVLTGPEGLPEHPNQFALPLPVDSIIGNGMVAFLK